MKRPLSMSAYTFAILPLTEVNTRWQVELVNPLRQVAGLSISGCGSQGFRFAGVAPGRLSAGSRRAAVFATNWHGRCTSGQHAVGHSRRPVAWVAEMLAGVRPQYLESVWHVCVETPVE